MKTDKILNCLLDLGPRLSELDMAEATVRLPPRSRKWVAVYTGPEPGRQIARSTGLEDKEAALALAREWEDQARRQRMAQGQWLRKPTIRVRRRYGAEPGSGPLTQKEVAAILKLSERAVREIERRAFQKLRAHPLLRELWQEYAGQEHEPSVKEGNELALTDAEISALWGLAKTPMERQALVKLLSWIGRSTSEP